MKSFIVIALILAVVAAQVADPKTSDCKASAKCSANGEICDMSSQMYYCLAADYCMGANSTQNGTCATRIAKDGDCVSAVAGLQGNCKAGLVCDTNKKCADPPTSGPIPTVVLAYEGDACDTTGPYCVSGLSCIEKKCKKYFTGVADEACITNYDCKLGFGCDAQKCKKYTKAIGSTCAEKADCDGGANCWCTEKDSSTKGACQGNYHMDCQKAVDAWIAVGKIDSATKGASERACVIACGSAKDAELFLKPFAGYRAGFTPVNDADKCTYTTPSGCTPTTMAPTSAGAGSSASTIVASFVLVAAALLIAF